MSNPASDPDTQQAPAGAHAPGIAEAVEALGQAGRESLESSKEMARAMRRLVAADIALARAALARAAVWMAVAVAFGASAWLLLMAALITGLNHLGLSWLAATSISAGVSLLITMIGGWQALRYFEMGKFDATRRHLAKLGIGGDGNEDDEESAGDAMTLDRINHRIARADRVLDGRQTQLKGNLAQIRGTWRSAWTPVRIVVSGVGLGFLFGKLDPEKSAGKLAGKFGAAPKVLQTLTALSSLLAASRAQDASDSADIAADEAEQTAQTMEQAAPDPGKAAAATPGVAHYSAQGSHPRQPAAAEAATDLGEDDR